jgi:spermidine/putrescine transport system substrate-binding protein
LANSAFDGGKKIMKSPIQLVTLFIFLGTLISSCSSSDKDLQIYIWGDYIKPELIERFESENGCSVIVDTFDSNESMYAKLNLGASGYDLIFPSNYFADIMQKQGMLEEIDATMIPNFHFIDATYLKMLNFSKGIYGVPFTVSYSGIAYRNNRIKNPDQSWSIFDRHDLKGRMTMLNDLREVLGAALKFLGFSINTINPIEIRQATNILIEWKKNLAKFESEQYKNGIASAEYLVVQGYSGDILQVMQENPNVSFFLPKEGSVISIDVIALPRDAYNKKLAYAFINFLLDPEVAAENMAYTRFVSPNSGAYEKLSPQLKNNPALFPPKEILDKSELIKNLGSHAELYNRAWDQLKAAE